MPRQWVDLMERSSVRPGDVVSVDRHDLVVWSTADGELCAMDSRCPHQWSHLGAEGVVDGAEIVCTTHFWRFGCDGRGSKLSMNGRRDEKSGVDVFEVREVGGTVQVLLGEDRLGVGS